MDKLLVTGVILGLGLTVRRLKKRLMQKMRSGQGCIQICVPPEELYQVLHPLPSSKLPDSFILKSV